MIQRQTLTTVLDRLAESPAVALVGPRQVGKTTLALDVAAARPSLYLDLESAADLARLTEPAAYLAGHADRLVILDEIQRVPGLFPELRGLIDRGRRSGRPAGQYLLLGSASLDLLRQSGESLAGRIAHVELGPFNILEVGADRIDDLWVRGGFPESFLARSDAASLRWRLDFIRSYLERDVPQLGPRIPAETLRRFWTMLAHAQGGLCNLAELGRGLGVDARTSGRYLGLLVDLLLVRRLEPWHANVGKRLVKSPKVFIRDSGLVHALLGLRDKEALLGHPVAGPSWEGLVVETLAAALPEGGRAHFYRTAAGAEVDLLLALPGERLWAIEIKRSLAPKVSRGVHQACADLKPERRFVLYGGQERYPLGDGFEAVGLAELAALVASGA